MPAPRRRCTGIAVLLFGVTGFFGTPAAAQFGGSVAVESDYRFRGVTLSDNRPDARLSVAYDHASGWYAGASLTRVVFEPWHDHAALYAYAGYSQSWTPTLRWEAGAMQAFYGGDTRYDYHEGYIGLIGERWSSRLYVSDNYFGSDVRTAYVELDGGWPISASWRLIGHVGTLASLSGGLSDGMSRARIDARVGASWTHADGMSVQLAWAGSTPGGPYPSIYERKRSNFIVTLSYAF